MTRNLATIAKNACQRGLWLFAACDAFDEGRAVVYLRGSQGDSDMNPQDQGFRFCLQGGIFDWFHPLEIKPGAIDCTDMGDDEFEALVRAQGA